MSSVHGLKAPYQASLISQPSDSDVVVELAVDVAAVQAAVAAAFADVIAQNPMFAAGLTSAQPAHTGELSQRNPVRSWSSQATELLKQLYKDKIENKLPVNWSGISDELLQKTGEFHTPGSCKQKAYSMQLFATFAKEEGQDITALTKPRSKRKDGNYTIWSREAEEKLATIVTNSSERADIDFKKLLKDSVFKGHTLQSLQVKATRLRKNMGDSASSSVSNKKFWSKEEEVQLLNLMKNKQSIKEIAKQFDRTPEAVGHKIRKLRKTLLLSDKNETLQPEVTHKMGEKTLQTSGAQHLELQAFLEELNQAESPPGLPYTA